MSNALEIGIYGTLAAGTALTALLGGTAIYNGQPARDVTLPWVTFSLASGREENLTPTDTQRLVHLVKGVAASLQAAGSIASEIHALLHHGAVTVTGGTVFWAARETIVRYQEIDPGGHVIGHAGGEYAFRVQ